MKVKYYRCPVCNKPYKTLNGWGEHISSLHPEILKEGYSYARLFYYIKTGRTHGTCVECKGDTEWNEASWKYERYCKNPECKKNYVKKAHQRNRDKYGKSNLLNEPERQRIMLANRRISGEVKFHDGGSVKYVGSYEHNFLDMLNDLLEWSSNDIVSPSPHTYYYEYKNPKDKENEGTKFYIPDFYIPSINFEIEIKQSNTTHQKMIEIDRIKEQCKDEMMKKRKDVKYIKIIDNDFSNFFTLLLDLKEKYLLNPEKKEIVKRNREMTPSMENFLFKQSDITYNLDKFGKECNILFITGLSGSGKTTLSNEYADMYKCEVLHLDEIECDRYPEGFEFLKKRIHNEIPDYSEACKLYYSKDIEKMPDEQANIIYDKMDKAMFICIDELKNHKNSNYIIEGIQIYQLFNADFLRDYPVVIKGTSVLSSVYRRVKRNSKKYFSAIKREMMTFLYLNAFKYEDKKLDRLRNGIKQYPVNESTLPIAQESWFNLSKFSNFYDELRQGKNVFGFIKQSAKTSSSSSGAKRYCGVNIEDGMIKVYGIKVSTFERRVENYYKDKSLKNIFMKKYEASSYQRYLKKKIGKSQITVDYLYTPEFFALELCKLFSTLSTRYRDKNYMNIANQIYDNSWLGRADKVTEHIPLLSLNNLEKLDLELTGYQKEFIQLYPRLKANLNLNGYILAFEQGLGKTVTAIGLLECLEKDKVYIVCPNSLKPNWALEIKKYYKKYQNNEALWKREVYICGTNQEFYPDETRFIITNNESIPKMYPYITDKGENILILDESHNFRNLKGKRTSELIELRDKLKCKDVLVMSGTPIKAAPSEIVPALLLIDPSFTMEAANIYSKAFKLDKTLGTEIVESRFGQIMYRKEKDELPNLPNKNIQYLKADVSNRENYLMSTIRNRVMERFNEIFADEIEKSEDYRIQLVDLVNRYSSSTEEDKKMYLNWLVKLHTKKEITDMHELDYEFMQGYSEKFIYPNISEKSVYEEVRFLEKKFIRMKERCLGLALGEIVPPARVEMFIKLYDENTDEIIDRIVESPKKTVIFSQFKSVVNHIVDDLNARDIGAVKITGDVNSTQRLENLTQFKEDDMVRVIVATSQTIGVGVTLIEANQMFFYGPPWRSTDFEQCTDRIHRIGQTDDVNIYNVVLDTGTEENLSSRMDSILQWSSEMFTSVISKTDSVKDSEGEQKFEQQLVANESAFSLAKKLIIQKRPSSSQNNTLYQEVIVAYNKLKEKYVSIKPVPSDNYYGNVPVTVPYLTFKKKFAGQDWDISQYLETELSKYGNVKNYYIELIHNGKCYNHTITTTSLDDGIMLIETQFSMIEGLYYPMTLTDILNYVISAMASEKGIPHVKEYSVYEYHIDNSIYGGRTETELINYIKRNGKRIPLLFNRNFIVNKVDMANESMNGISDDLRDFLMIAYETEIIDEIPEKEYSNSYEIRQYFGYSETIANEDIPKNAVIESNVCINDIDGKISTLKSSELCDSIIANPVSSDGNVMFRKRIEGLQESYDLISTKEIKKGEKMCYDSNLHFPEFYAEDRL